MIPKDERYISMKIVLLATLTILSLTANLKAQAMKLGDDIPEVTTINEEGQTLNLHESASKGLTLIYFYPKADTPGCTAQACSLRDAYEAITDAGVTVYGVSTDKPEKQKAFKEKYDLPFTLIADHKKEVVKAFGVSTIMGFADRQAYLFNDGTLIWLDTNASTKKQADDVLKFIQSME